jgi:hypothetical protein
VPIYDARSVNEDFFYVLDGISSLAKLREEIPKEACAIVAYTINEFYKKGDDIKSISFNIQWAMRLSDARGQGE